MSTPHRWGAAVLVPIVAVVGLAIGADDAGSASVEPVDPYAVAVPPSQVRAAVRAVDGIVHRVRQRSGIPGVAVAVVDRGRVLTRGYGTTNTAGGRKVDADTVFQLASLSKAVGATVVARAVDRGQVAWSDPVVDHLPGFRLADPYVTAHVTIEDLYAQRSGLPEHAGDLLDDLGVDRGTILERLHLLPLAPFRATYGYTNFGIVAAADAVARAAGTPWGDLSRRLVYRPLAMTHTSSRGSDFTADPNHAALHVKVGRRWVARYARNADVQTAASGVSSSAHDMGHWLAMLAAKGMWRGRRILSSEQVANLRGPRVDTVAPTGDLARPEQYALGMDVDVDATARVRVSHSGGSALGAATAFQLSPATGVGIVVLTNAAPVGAAESIAAEFMDRALLGHPSRDWYARYRPAFARLATHPGSLGETPPGDPQAALGDAAYVGSYTSPFYGTLRVVAGDGGLAMQLGPGPMTFPLRHWTGNTFAYETAGENASGNQPVLFAVTGSRATAVTVTNLNDAAGGSLGVFPRAG